jgi:hypothetical protein
VIPEPVAGPGQEHESARFRRAAGEGRLGRRARLRVVAPVDERGERGQVQARRRAGREQQDERGEPAQDE